MPVGSPLVNLQVKTSQETFRQFEDAYSTSECTTKGQFLEAIIESYLNPPKGKTVEVTKQEDQDTIQNLTNEIGRLKIEIDLKEDDINKATDLYVEVAGNLANLERELNEKPVPVISEYEVLLAMPPIMSRVLDIEAATAFKKTGERFTKQDILLNSFWESVTVGRVYPWKAWSRSELAKLATELKAAGQ